MHPANHHRALTTWRGDSSHSNIHSCHVIATEAARRLLWSFGPVWPMSTLTPTPTATSRGTDRAWPPPAMHTLHGALCGAHSNVCRLRPLSWWEMWTGGPERLEQLCTLHIEPAQPADWGKDVEDVEEGPGGYDVGQLVRSPSGLGIGGWGLGVVGSIPSLRSADRSRMVNMTRQDDDDDDDDGYGYGCSGLFRVGSSKCLMPRVQKGMLRSSAVSRRKVRRQERARYHGPLVSMVVPSILGAPSAKTMYRFASAAVTTNPHKRIALAWGKSAGFGGQVGWRCGPWGLLWSRTLFPFPTPRRMLMLPLLVQVQVQVVLLAPAARPRYLRCLPPSLATVLSAVRCALSPVRTLKVCVRWTRYKYTSARLSWVGGMLVYCYHLPPRGSTDYRPCLPLLLC